MKTVCSRCGETFDSSLPEMNAERYGENIYSCPCCGKLYRFSRVISVDVEEIDDIEVTNQEIMHDDWGHPVVTDVDYEAYESGKKSPKI